MLIVLPGHGRVNNGARLCASARLCKGSPVLLARKHINEHRVVHDYGLYAMVKTLQVGDLYARANFVSKLVACPQHQRKLVQCHKMCLPDLKSVYIVSNLPDTPICFGIILFIFYGL